ncbi:MAG: tripartite tricarboxylate transporter substrate binding protein, partial [Roseomonas sp.]|nr:tripartite tricarboxylate transporter substrate binding protein [Roseomonas sp.]
MFTRRQASVLAGGLLAAPWVKPAWAAWPQDRAIEMIVPFPPGGGVDATARFATHQVTPRLPGVR